MNVPASEVRSSIWIAWCLNETGGRLVTIEGPFDFVLRGDEAGTRNSSGSCSAWNRMRCHWTEGAQEWPSVSKEASGNLLHQYLLT